MPRAAGMIGDWPHPFSCLETGIRRRAICESILSIFNTLRPVYDHFLTSTPHPRSSAAREECELGFMDISEKQYHELAGVTRHC